MAHITIDKTCCKGCDICLTVCPKRIFTISKNRNNYGTTMPTAENPETCITCRICERMCPEGAIDVEESGVNNED